jgi:hypothetical protein
MREPIPLFASVSYKLHARKASSNDWEPYGGHGDGDDDANRLAFGDLSFDDLRALRAHADDPEGPSPQRALRFADYLWSTVEASARELG